MQKTHILPLTLIIALIFGISFGFAIESMEASDMCIPIGVITLTPPESVEAKRVSVEFDHSLHFEINCNDCHHMWEKDEPIKGCMTSECHELTESPEKAGGSEFEGEESILYYKNAFHKKCIGCHKAMKASNKQLELSKRALPDKLPATGPTGCIQCHPKEE